MAFTNQEAILLEEMIKALKAANIPTARIEAIKVQVLNKTSISQAERAKIYAKANIQE